MDQVQNHSVARSSVEPGRTLALPRTPLEPWGYLAALGLTELVANLWQPAIGLWLHALLAVLLIRRGLQSVSQPDGRFYLAASIMPIVRIVSFAISPHLVSGVWYYVGSETPVLAAALVATRVLHLPRSTLGIRRPRSISVSILVIATGLAAGWCEGLIIHPPALAQGYQASQIVLPAVLLIVFTGFVEELVFRGLIQHTATSWLGVVPGILLTAVGWSLLHIGWKSGLDVVFVCTVGLIWGWVRHWNRSTLDLSIAHGFANVVLFLILPTFR